MIRDHNEDFNNLYEMTQRSAKEPVTEGVDDGERETEAVDNAATPVNADNRDIPDPPEEVSEPDTEEPMDVSKEFIGQNDDTYYYLICSEEDGGERDMMIVDQNGTKALSAKEMQMDVSSDTIPAFLMKVFQEGLIAQIESSVFTKYILPEIMREDDDEEEELIDEPEEMGEEPVDGDPGEEEIVEESIIHEEAAVITRPRKTARDEDSEDEIEASHDQMTDTEDKEVDVKDKEKAQDAEAKAGQGSGPATEQDIEDAYNYFLRSAKSSSDPIRKNSKTGLSIDFDMECPYRKEGKACSYCYVENSRTNAKAWISRLMINGGLTLQQIKDNSDAGKYVHVPGPEWYKVVQRKDPVVKGESTFSMGASGPSKISGRVEYKSGTLQRKRSMFNPEKVAELNASGGVRMYSFSDYNPEDDDSLGRLFDDADEIGLKIKAITKMPEFVEKWSSRTGVTHISVDNLAQYGMESNSLSMDAASKLASGNDKVEIRAVAFNPAEAIEYAKHPAVGIVTPFHGKISKLPPELQKMTQDMGHGMPASNELMALIKTELSDEEKGKFCCYTGKCNTCKVGCGKGEKTTCDIDWDEIIDDVIDKNTKSMGARGNRKKAVESTDNSRCPFRIVLDEKQCKCNPDKECTGECDCGDCRCAGEGKCQPDSEADDMSRHEVYEGGIMLIEMIITDKEGNQVEVKLEDESQLPGDEAVDAIPSTHVSVNGQVFTFSKEFLENWRDMDGMITEEGLKELALDALSGLDQEEYHALLAAGPGVGEEEPEDNFGDEEPEAGMDAAPEAEPEDKPFESVVDEAGNALDDEAREAGEDVTSMMSTPEDDEDEYEDDDEYEEEDPDAYVPTMYEVADEASALRPDANPRVKKLFREAFGYYFAGHVEEDDNAFYKNNLYAQDYVNRMNLQEPLEQFVNELLWEFEGQIGEMTPEEIADEIFDRFAEGVGERLSEAVEEKKAAPSCSKCNKAHWPFQPCSGGAEGDKPKDEAETPDKEEKAPEADEKDVKESVSITEQKSMDRLYMLLES